MDWWHMHKGLGLRPGAARRTFGSDDSSQLPEGSRADAPLGVDFDTPEKTRTWLDRIAARSTEMNATMQPTDTVADEDRNRLAEWIACGAPE